MTPNNEIEVYFHMRNHYKRLKHVKSVVDSSAPKGRSRKKSKSPKRSSARHKSSSRPPTRRNQKDMPIQSKGAGEVSPSDHQFKPDSIKLKTSEDTFGSDQHEYLQFSLRITEDIIKNDLYTNDQMRQVLNSHYEANKGRLCKDKMMTTMLELCKELNILFHECDPTSMPVPQPIPKPMCICDSKQVQTLISVNSACECTNKRNPPVECRTHTENVNIMEKPVSEIIINPSISKVTIKEEATSKIINNDENLIQHKCLCGSPSCDSLRCDAVSHNFEYVEQEPEPEIEEQEDQPNVETEEEENIGMDKCHCGNECCDRDRLFIFLEHYKKKLSQPTNIHEFGISHYMTYIEPKINCTTDLSIHTSQHNMPSKLQVFEPKETCITDLTLQTQHLLFKSQQSNANASTSITGIGTTPINYLKEPKKPIGVNKICKGTETVKFNCEQKTENPNLGNEHNDFIIFEGPVLIPKATLQSVEGLSKACKNSEYVTNYFSQPPVEYIKSVQFPTQKYSAPQTNSSVSTEYTTDMVPEPQKYGYTKKTDVLYQRNYDYDLTPQKDTLLYESNVKCEKTQCCSCKTNRNSNLLLGGQYDKIICVEEIESNKYTKFYPSIATQVTSMELLPNLLKKPLDTLETPRQNAILPRQVSINLQPNTVEPQIAQGKAEAEAESQNIANKNRPLKPTPSVQLLSNNELYTNSLDKVPQVFSTDSMDARIEMLRIEMEKFNREEDVETKNSASVSGLPDENLDRYDFKTTDAVIRGSANSKHKGRVSINTKLS